MIPDKNRIYDGFTSLEGGVDAGREPSLLEVNQCAAAENLTFRGGRAMTRPGIRRLTVTKDDITNKDHSYDTRGIDAGMLPDGITYRKVTGNSAYDAYKLWIFQGAICYSPHHGEDCIIAMFGGRPFKIIPLIDKAIVTEIEPITDENTPFFKPPPNPENPEMPEPPGEAPEVAPPNDNFANAIELFGPSYDPANLITGTTVGATTETGEPTGPPPTAVKTVWYKWVGLSDDTEEYFWTRANFWIDIYTGSEVDALTHIVSGLGNSELHFTQVRDTTYYIRIRPPNDASAAPFTIGWHTGPVPPQPIPLKSYRNNRYKPIAYMVQADKWMVIQDGESKPILYDGNTAVRSKCGETDREKTEVPIGTIMAYGMGRIIVAVNERDIAFGDLYGSHPFADPADSLILFTERNFLAEGQDAAIPFTNGRVTGLSFIPQLDTTTGTGQLLAFAERGATSFALDLPRLLWKTSEFQTRALVTTGLRGHRSISAVNEDLWFRSDDGLRSYRQARSEPTGWAHLPLSTNVKQFLKNDSERLLKYASSVYFDNRVICTTEPAWNNGRVFHNGLVVVDFEILSSFGTKYRPAWDGHWTPGTEKEANLPKVKICQVFSGTFGGKERAFFFGMIEIGKDNIGNPIFENELFEFTANENDDWDFQKIPWSLESRAYDFKAGQSTPFNENLLYDGDIWVSEITE